MDKIALRAQRRREGIRPIYPKRRDRKALEESDREEDFDLAIVEDIPEECPTCDNEQELISFIKDSVVSRNLNWLVIHCTATGLKASVQAILNYWKNVLGWNNPGYHIIFSHDGSFTVTADFDTICNGVRGFNRGAVHLSYVGGIDANNKPFDNMTDAQFKMMTIAVKEMIKRWPHLKSPFMGHRDFPNVAKACPCFDTRTKFSLLLK